MKAITLSVQITGVSAKVDGSLGLRFATPELSTEQKALVMGLMNTELTMLLQERGTEGVVNVSEIKSEFDKKSPGQRLRNVLFVWWQQQGGKGMFDAFYIAHMEKLIDHVKAKLEPDK